MKRVSDEHLASLCEILQRRAHQNSVYRDSLDIATELQSWRAAFRGVEMVVPVEWETKHYMDRLYTSTGRHLVALAYKLDNRQPFESGLGVIRLDELSGDAGELAGK